MEKKHIISLGGELASGKGTVSKILMKDLNFGVYKNGDYFRKLAKDMGMDVTTFNIYVKEHPEILFAPRRRHDDHAVRARAGPGGA